MKTKQPQPITHFRPPVVRNDDDTQPSTSEQSEKIKAFSEQFFGFVQEPPPVTIHFTIQGRFAPAFRSAIEEICNEVGGRLEGSYSFSTEQSITDAMTALTTLRKAVIAAIPQNDSPAYRW